MQQLFDFCFSSGTLTCGVRVLQINCDGGYWHFAVFQWQCEADFPDQDVPGSIFPEPEFTGIFVNEPGFRIALQGSRSGCQTEGAGDTLVFEASTAGEAYGFG